jgi:UDP-glucose 4-epimerase
MGTSAAFDSRNKSTKHYRIALIKEGVMMPKILVTGGAGFIGSHVVDLFLSKGYDVVVVDDLSTGRHSNLNPQATFYQIDIRSPKVWEVFAVERPDYVSHHAAQMDVRRSVTEPLFDADVNILGLINLLECAREFDVKHFVYISSGGAAYGEPDQLPCDEEHSINPICPYVASKHTVEHYLYMHHANYGLKYTVLRYPNVFGPRQNPHGEAGVVAIFTGKMLAEECAIVNGDGEQTRDFVYVGDCARANYLALTVDHQSGVYNLGWGRPLPSMRFFMRWPKPPVILTQCSTGPPSWVKRGTFIWMPRKPRGNWVGHQRKPWNKAWRRQCLTFAIPKCWSEILSSC